MTSQSLPFANRDFLTLKEHREIVKALESKDTEKAIQCSKKHNEIKQK